MEQILEELNNIPGVFGSMIIGKDGLVIATAWDQELDTDMVGAHSADLLNVAESMMSEKLDYGNADLVTVESPNARFFLKNIDEATFMAVAASPKSNLGLIRIEIRAAADRLKEVL